MTPEKALFDRAANIWREIATLQADLAELKIEFSDKVNAMSKEDITDTIAAAKLHVADQNKRAKADEKRIRREEIAERLAGASAKTAARVADERRRVEVHVASKPGEHSSIGTTGDATWMQNRGVGTFRDGSLADKLNETMSSVLGLPRDVTTLDGRHVTFIGGEIYDADGVLLEPGRRLHIAPARKPTDADLEECN